MNKVNLILFISFFYLNISAQKSKHFKSKISIRMEEVKNKCKDIEEDKKIRIAVSKFQKSKNLDERGEGSSNFVGNLSTMLTSALSQSNCFNVLAELKDKSVITKEIDETLSEYTDAEFSIEKGKMKLPQIIIIGEVTEFSLTERHQQVMGFGATSSSVKAGFILNLINPKTREIVKSASFNVESTTGKVSETFFGIQSSSKVNPAIADALEKGIIEAVEYIVSEKDNFQLKTDEKEFSKFLINVEIKDVSLTQANQIEKILKTFNGVKNVKLK